MTSFAKLERLTSPSSNDTSVDMPVEAPSEIHEIWISILVRVLAGIIVYRNFSIKCPGRLFNFGPMRIWALTRGGRLFQGGSLLFSQQFQQARTFLELTSSFRFNNTKESAKSNKQYKSSLTTVSKTNFGT